MYFFFVMIIFVRFVDRDLILIPFRNSGKVHGISLATRFSFRMMLSLSLSSFRFGVYRLPWCPVSTADFSSPNRKPFFQRSPQLSIFFLALFCCRIIKFYGALVLMDLKLFGSEIREPLCNILDIRRPNLLSRVLHRNANRNKRYQ